MKIRKNIGRLDLVLNRYMGLGPPSAAIGDNIPASDINILQCYWAQL